MYGLVWESNGRYEQLYFISVIDPMSGWIRKCSDNYHIYSLDIVLILVTMVNNNIRKAMTEKSKLKKAYRDKDIW